MKTIKELQQPKGQFLLGNLKDFKAADKHRVLENWVSECGELFKIRLATKQFIVSADAKLNHEILKQRPHNFRRFSKISEIMEEMGIHGVFNAEGERWKLHRSLTTEALNARNVQQFFPILSQTASRLLEKWNSAAENKTIVDVQRDMMRYTVDITTMIAFGYKMNTLEEEGDVIQTHLEKIFPMINSRITAPLPTWRWIPSQKDKELKIALKSIEEAVHSFIKKGKEELQSNPDKRDNPTNFLEALLVEQENNPKFSDKEVYGNVFTMLLAGEDTTSNSLSWTIFFLTQHPQYISKIREEAFTVYGNDSMPSSYETLKQLKWADAIVQEAMRLRPVTPTLYMQALADVSVEDLQIEKGTTVMLQNKVPQTNEKHFFDPNEFKPERWMPSGCPVHAAHSPEVMRAFGGGARFCPGKTLAMSELVLTISMLCKNFDMNLAVNKEDVKEVFAFTMYPDNCLINVSKA